jgi:hypothetical protein
VFELRIELYEYLTEVSYDSVYVFDDSGFIMKVSYLIDLFAKLNTRLLLCKAVKVIFLSSVKN